MTIHKMTSPSNDRRMACGLTAGKFRRGVDQMAYPDKLVNCPACLTAGGSHRNAAWPYAAAMAESA